MPHKAPKPPLSMPVRTYTHDIKAPLTQHMILWFSLQKRKIWGPYKTHYLRSGNKRKKSQVLSATTLHYSVLMANSPQGFIARCQPNRAMPNPFTLHAKSRKNAPLSALLPVCAPSLSHPRTLSTPLCTRQLARCPHLFACLSQPVCARSHSIVLSPAHSWATSA